MQNQSWRTTNKVWNVPSWLSSNCKEWKHCGTICTQPKRLADWYRHLLRDFYCSSYEESASNCAPATKVLIEHLPSTLSYYQVESRLLRCYHNAKPKLALRWNFRSQLLLCVASKKFVLVRLLPIGKTVQKCQKLNERCGSPDFACRCQGLISHGVTV